MRASIILGIARTIPFCFGSAQAGDFASSAADGIENGPAHAAIAALERDARRGDERCKLILGMWSLAETGE